MVHVGWMDGFLGWLVLTTLPRDRKAVKHCINQAVKSTPRSLPKVKDEKR